MSGNMPLFKKRTQLLSKQEEGRIIRKNCRAVPIENVTTFVRCETEEPKLCRFTLKFRNARLCMHPLAQKIVERTKKKNL
jgi:hypothetical protein